MEKITLEFQIKTFEDLFEFLRIKEILKKQNNIIELHMPPMAYGSVEEEKE